MMVEGSSIWSRRSGSSALECGHLKLWIIDVLGNTIHFMDLESRGLTRRGCRSKASSPDRLFHIGNGNRFSLIMTQSQRGEGGGEGAKIVNWPFHYLYEHQYSDWGIETCQHGQTYGPIKQLAPHSLKRHSVLGQERQWFSRTEL